ncbi:hypothetical protein LMG28614_03203 [Paraburkholderia ultramafica]|uniref:Uncharacterized protein n=1 Tax=Paraburkholderia ultramafica TaxID=1544867 RepID=A0A6S7B7Z8_9BURK|nr:hypothetical protein [Paraburkholderia ultramafica]CAB3790951.1 hypothetical protein LMG28614_03203 [Paraburkholderia ultramafica]
MLRFDCPHRHKAITAEFKSSTGNSRQDRSFPRLRSHSSYWLMLTLIWVAALLGIVAVRFGPLSVSQEIAVALGSIAGIGLLVGMYVAESRYARRRLQRRLDMFENCDLYP